MPKIPFIDVDVLTALAEVKRRLAQTVISNATLVVVGLIGYGLVVLAARQAGSNVDTLGTHFDDVVHIVTE